MTRTLKLIIPLIIIISAIVAQPLVAQADLGHSSHSSHHSSYHSSHHSSYNNHHSNYSSSSTGSSTDSNTFSISTTVMLLLLLTPVIMILWANRPKPKKDEKEIYAILQEHNINPQELLEELQKSFLTLQKAWSEKDLRTLFELETRNLYKKHLDTIEDMNYRNESNIIEDIEIEDIHFLDITNKEPLDVTVYIKAYMKDYYVTFNKFTAGSRNRVCHVYRYTFKQSYPHPAQDGASWKLSKTE